MPSLTPIRITIGEASGSYPANEVPPVGLPANTPNRFNAQVAALTNISLSGTPILDGYQTTVGDRVIAIAQTNPANNGVYVVQTGAWVRAIDLSLASQFSGPVRVSVERGTVGRNKTYEFLPTSTVVIGTTPLTFTESSRREQMDIIVGKSYYKLTDYAPNDFTGDVGAVLNELLGDGVAVGLGGNGLNAIPVGVELRVPAGVYRVVTPIVMKRWVNIIMEGDAIIQAAFTTSAPLFTVSIRTGLTGNTDTPRNMLFEGGMLANYSGTGEALLVDMGTGTTGSLFGYLIFRSRFASKATIDGTLQKPAIRFTGYVGGSVIGPTFCGIDWCSIDGGVHFDNVADGNSVTNSKIFGATARGVILNIVTGGYNTKIDGNAITCGQGTFEVIKGTDFKFTNNQCEQGAGAINTLLSVGGLTAMFVVRGANDGSGDPTIQSGLISGNHFGCGVGLVQVSGILDWCEDVVVTDNVHFTGDPAINIDIRLTANSRNNFIGKPRHLRGARTTGYDARADKKFVVQDLGQFNGGFSEPLANIGALVNGFTSGTGYIRRNRDGGVELEGQISVGASFTAGVTIGTLPVQFRPVNYTQFPVSINSAVGIVGISSAGVMTLDVPPAGIANGHIIYIGSIRYAARERAVYDGKD